MGDDSFLAAALSSRSVMRRALPQIAYWGDDEESARVAFEALRAADEAFKQGLRV